MSFRDALKQRMKAYSRGRHTKKFKIKFLACDLSTVKRLSGANKNFFASGTKFSTLYSIF